MTIDTLDALFEHENFNFLEIVITEDARRINTHGFLVLSAVTLAGLLVLLAQILFEEIGALDTVGSALCAEFEVLQLVRIVNLREATLELPIGQQLGTHVTEKVDETLGGGRHGLIAEVLKQAEVLNLLWRQRERHPHKYLADRVQADRNMLVMAVLSDEIGYDSFDDGADGLRRYQLMARLNDHGEDLGDLILVVAGQVAQQVRIELQHLNLVTANKSRNQTQHIQFDLVAVIALLELGEQFIHEASRIVQRIDRQEVRGELDKTFTRHLTFLDFDCFLELCLAMLRHLGTLALLEQLDLLVALFLIIA